MRVGDELGRRQLGAVEVAVGDLDAAEADLALVAVGLEGRGVGRVGHVHLHAAVAREADREAVRRARRVVRASK